MQLNKLRGYRDVTIQNVGVLVDSCASLPADETVYFFIIIIEYQVKRVERGDENGHRRQH